MLVPHVLVIENDVAARRLLGQILRNESVRVLFARDESEGLTILRREPIDVAFVDLSLCSGKVSDVLEEARRSRPELATVGVIGAGSSDASVTAVQDGACDYVIKPITRDNVISALDRALNRSRLLNNSAKSCSETPGSRERLGNGSIVALSRSMRDVLALVARVAPTNAPVVIQGEPGVGKERIARIIHRQSERAHGPFVCVDCGGLPKVQFISELFGRAAEPSAETPCGLLGQANGGTILLDEVGRMPPWAAGRLLEALQDGWLPRPGGEDAVPLDVRVVASTTRDLEAELAEGGFHRGLFYFLNVVAIRIPPLRQRQEDLKVLANHFLERFGRRQSGTDEVTPHFSREAWDCLLRYEWPGNVRELANVIQRAVLLVRSEEITPADVPELVRRPDASEYGETITVPLAGNLREIERHIIEEVIKRCRGNKAAAARTLGLDRRSLYRRLAYSHQAVSADAGSGT